MNYNGSHYGIDTECYTDLIAVQPAIERIEFSKLFRQDLGLEPSTEAFNNPSPIAGAGRSRLVEILYQDIMSKSRVDFGSIPNSRGDITRVSFYKTMTDSIDSLNKLLGDRANESMVRMNELHEAIIAERQAFDFAYKVNIELVQLIYCTLVEALMDLINENIVMYVDYLKETQNVDVPGKIAPRATNRRVTTSVDQWLKIRKSGEWKRLMDSYRKDYTKNFVGVATIITGAVVGAGVLAALLWAIRSLIYVYFNTSVKVDEKARAMSNYLNAVSASETDEKALAKQQKYSAKLDHVATFIETRILKDNAKIDMEMRMADAKINKTALTAPSIASRANVPDNSGFELDI